MAKKSGPPDPQPKAKAARARDAQDSMKGERGQGTGGQTRKEKLRKLGLPKDEPQNEGWKK